METVGFLAEDSIESDHGIGTEMKRTEIRKLDAPSPRNKNIGNGLHPPRQTLHVHGRVISVIFSAYCKVC